MGRPRIRTIKPEFFSDEKVNEVSRDARYLVIGLITRADDRGRQQNMEQAILGHVYPAGDVTPRQLGKWLGEIIDIGISWAYEKGPFAYLWLPHFWRHQKINRPSESVLPPHPEDRYQDLPIKDAIKAFRIDNGMEHDTEKSSEQFTESLRDGLTPPRAGACSVPFPSSPRSTSESTDAGASDLAERIDDACMILASVPRWLIEPVAVENVEGMYPDIDIVQAARLAVTWGTDPSWELPAAATLRSAAKKLHEEVKQPIKARRETPSELLQALEGAA